MSSFSHLFGPPSDYEKFLIEQKTALPGETPEAHIVRMAISYEDKMWEDALKKPNAKLFNEEFGEFFTWHYQDLQIKSMDSVLVLKLPVDGALFTAPASWPSGTCSLELKLLTPYHAHFTSSLKSQIKSKLLAVFPNVIKNTEGFDLTYKFGWEATTIYVNLF